MPPRLAAAFLLLGVDPWYRSQQRAIRSQEDADRFRDELVTEAQTNFRRLIKAAHPDAGGSQERAQELIQAKGIVTKCRFRYQPPIPSPVTTVVFHWGTGTGTGTTTTSTAGNWSPGMGI